MVRGTIYFFVLILTMATCGYAVEERYSNPTLGFSIVKPADWNFVTADENLDNIARSEFKEGVDKKTLIKYATAAREELKVS